MLSLASLLAGTGAVYLLHEATSPTDKKSKLDVLITRDESGLSKETNDLIDLITVDPETFPVGSFKYRAHKYPGDIDIFEPIKACCTKNTAAKAIASKIQGVIRKVNKNKEIFLGDFKAGLDDRYIIDIGELKDGHIFDYNRKKVIEELNKLRNENLLTDAQFQELFKKASKNKMNIKDWEDLNESLRKYYVVRWSVSEVLAGKKSLPGGKTLPLEEAITHNSLVKLDLWGKLHGRYNEITNFFLIVMLDEEGNETVLNAELGDRLANLQHDIQKYSSKEHRNSLKLAKRLWNTALFEKDKQMYEKLYPLFDSDAAMLSQVAGESEVLRFMLEKIPADQLPLKDIVKQIDGFRERINNTFKIQMDTKPLNRLINQIVRQYNKLDDNIDKDLILENLSSLEKKLKVPIEKYSKEYLESVGIKK